MTKGELQEAIDETYQTALDMASLEAFEGQYNELELAKKNDENRSRRKPEVDLGFTSALTFHLLAPPVP